jgi:hypothetical protein
METKGDILVKRTGVFERRADQGLITLPALAATYNVLRNSHAWLRTETDDNGAQDVKLPDATTLPLGFQVVIQNTGTVDSLNVKDNAGNLYKEVMKSHDPEFARAYRFTLVENADAAGLWHVEYLDDAGEVIPRRYVKPFNATTDWGSAAGGFYSQQVLESAHKIGTDPIFQIFQKVSSDFVLTNADQAKVLSTNGDVTFRVTSGDAEDSSDTDARFEGKIVLI